MTDTAAYVITGVLAVVALVLFMRTGSSRALSDQKRDEVRRKRAALLAKKKAEAREAARGQNNSGAQD